MKNRRRVVLAAAVLWLYSAPAHAQRAPDTRSWSTLRPTFADTTAAAFGVQEQGRYTKTGLIVGVIAGTVVGLGIGAFMALYCETSSDDCGNVLPVITVIGALSGAAAGAIIGAAIPRGRSGEVSPDPDVARRRLIGSASLAVGGGAARTTDAVGLDSRGTGASIRANLYAEVKPWLALGPEVGTTTIGGDIGNIRHAALAFRFSHDLPRFTPYVTANLGAYQTTGSSLEYLGGAIGAGARIDAARDGRYFFDVEVRHSRNAQNIEPMRMGTLSAGLGTYW